MPQYYIWTIGCQMNKSDSEYVASYLEEAGYSSVTTPEKADFILLNSCVVRQNAEDKVLNKLDSLKGLKKKSGDVTIALTGCLVDSRIDELKARFPWVDLFFPPQKWESLSRWAESRGLQPPQMSGLYPSTNPAVTAYVPVIQGCNSFCSYCVVPYRRGREKSRDPDEIVCQVQSLVRQGVKEVTLLGQNIGAYGRDLPARPDLADLLGELNGTEGLLRIRFLTNHPKDVNHKFIQAVAGLDKVCEHISLPIQAGDNDILAAMRRGYTAEQYRDLMAEIRFTIPGVALSTDVVVGFPDETAERFESTMRMLQQIRFDRVHVAAYSPRPHTIASRKLEDNVTAEEKEARLRRVEALHESVAAEINAGLLGKTVEVLVETKKRGKWQGRTRGDKLVFLADDADLSGRLVDVEIEKASAWALQGRRA